MKILTIILVLALFSPIAAGAQFDVSSVLSVSHLNPGDKNVEIQFITQNIMDSSLSNVKVHLYLKYPFSASISPNNNLGEISYPGYLVGAGGSGNEYTPYFDLGPNMSHTTYFKIDVDRNAKYGSYDLPYTIFYDTKEYRGIITLSIKGNTLIEIKNAFIETNNSKVEPGEIFKFVVSLENIGDNDIKWLRLVLKPRDNSIIPLSSDSEIIFKDIQNGTIRKSETWFSIEKDAAIKNYPIDIVLNYMDEKGLEYNETKLAGIATAGKAELDIAKKTTEPEWIMENEPMVLTVKIENTGTGDAKGVKARFESSLEGDTLAYLGEIKKDDYSNAIFTLNTGKAGKKTGILWISYEDDFGKHEVQKEIILPINPANGMSLQFSFIGLAAIASVMIFLGIRRKK